MIVLLNEHIVNLDNVCSMKRYYKITKTPGLPEMKDYFRIFVVYRGGNSEHINFETAEQMDSAFNSIIK